MEIVTFVVHHYTDPDRGHRFTATWGGLMRVDSDWYMDPAEAWGTLTARLAPHLARTAARALPEG